MDKCPLCDEPMSPEETTVVCGETMCIYCAQDQENDAAMNESYGAMFDYGGEA